MLHLEDLKTISYSIRNFIFYKEHMHSCERCGGKMKFIANENDIEKLKCPNCKDQFLDTEELKW